jgi:hypothetical protein
LQACSLVKESWASITAFPFRKAAIILLNFFEVVSAWQTLSGYLDPELTIIPESG